jgi:GH15 family glucan-1,4-alpha-glucosidase
MSLRIEDYALIGDCQTAALVGKDGSIDWLCFPRFDSAACFAALLGTSDHGRWKIAPAGNVLKTTRAYQPGTLVLETTFTTETGEVTITDCMPLRSGQPDLVRLVQGKRGKVAMDMDFVVRFDYGNVIPWVRKETGGMLATAGPETLHLRTRVPMHGEDMRTVAHFEVAAGEQFPFVLNWHASHKDPHPMIDANDAISNTAKWWRDWSDRCCYQGEWRDAVVRSLITLKALTYQPTGGIVAAPTTSLPEHIGGERNWDYRYCWLRDATFTLAALLQCGYVEEARAWREWLLRAVAGRGSQLHIMYGVAGERRLPESTLGWLPGYEDSPPVRIGNGAYDQFQLDVFGEVLDTLHLGRHFGLNAEDNDWRIERELLNRLEQVWQRPDEGIWEVRGPSRHFTHSKVMAWVAFDRAVKDAERYGLDGPIDRWRMLRDSLHAEICDQGFNKKLNSFVQSYGCDSVDASLLVMAELGFLPASDPRFIGTVAEIEKQLVREGFVERYCTASDVDGLPEGEGAFLLCTCWLADAYVLMGRHEDARRTFKRVLEVRNDVGLLAEEYDPQAKRQLGNFPQAFSHLGLINTARNLTQKEKPAEIRHQC